ncbi:hypothetical protein QNO07_01255 [Streptomyces sp. 549]|uniref:hypothetical protein n=1 Tax=Streptomyces sp. 549 TaxID=3049076 RepID=UPI0024C3C69E|nr:hypothetical protein [Streptomyces sp. 549]MDK1472068.1 hypothetical protein [Streptomyces sp. 549]
MARTDFTVEVSGTSGSHAGLWPEGECFILLPDGEHRAEAALTRVSLVKADAPLGPARWTAAAPQTTVAEVEQRTETLGTEHEDHPVLVLHDPAALDEVWCAVRPEPAPAGGEPRRFTVVDGEERPLCHISRGRSALTRRAYWRIDPADGSAPLTGHKGTLPGWLGFVLLLPLWCVFFVVSLLITLVTLGDTTELIVWGCPRRTVWRRRGERRAALDFRYLRVQYLWHDERLDRRVAFAQATLHQFAKYRAG